MALSSQDPVFPIFILIKILGLKDSYLIDSLIFLSIPWCKVLIPTVLFMTMNTKILKIKWAKISPLK